MSALYIMGYVTSGTQSISAQGRNAPVTFEKVGGVP